MAKYIRALIAGVILAVTASAASAAGLPLREPPADRAILALAESLRFKLARPDAPDAAVWAALVNETLFVARRLGLGNDELVVALREEGRFVAVVQGRGAVAGKDPDEVLGRLLYYLAAGDRMAARAAPVAIADQRLTDTLTHLLSVLR